MAGTMWFAKNPCGGCKFSPPEDFWGAVASLLFYQPCFNASTHVETEDFSNKQIEWNRINCKVLATLGKETRQWRRPVHWRKEEPRINADWIEVLWDNQPVLTQKVFLDWSHACWFVVMILGCADTNVACFVRMWNGAF